MSYVKERFFKGGDFHGLADIRQQARQWCLQTAGQRVHGTTQHLPLVVFQEEEQAKLLPWNGEPYDVPDWRNVTVHPDHHIAYRYALYSAPDSTCPPGTKLEVRGDSKLVRLYNRGVLVKVHPRKPRGGRSTDPEDYPKELTAYTLRSPNYMRRQLAEMGEDVGAFAERLFGGPTPWSKLRQAQKMLRLGERYTPARLNAACRRALAVDLIDVRRLERILIEALEEEATPATTVATAPPGRFVRPGNAFAIVTNRNEGRALMSTTTELKPLLKRLKLGAMLDTLPERLALARRDQLDYAAFLQILLADEVERRDNRNLEVRLQKAGFEEICRLEDFDWSAGIKARPPAH